MRKVSLVAALFAAFLSVTAIADMTGVRTKSCNKGEEYEPVTKGDNAKPIIGDGFKLVDMTGVRIKRNNGASNILVASDCHQPAGGDCQRAVGGKEFAKRITKTVESVKC